MKTGDLVRKRWGKLEVYQQGTVGVVIEKKFIEPEGLNPMLSGSWILVAYPNYRPYAYRPQEFEVVSEGG